MNSRSVTNLEEPPGASEGLPGWDVMQVVYHQEDGGHMRIANSFVIARDASGNLIRKTDILLDRWEVVSDEEMLRGFQKCFDNRDRMMADRAKYLNLNRQMAFHRAVNAVLPELPQFYLRLSKAFSPQVAGALGEFTSWSTAIDPAHTSEKSMELGYVRSAVRFVCGCGELHDRRYGKDTGDCESSSGAGTDIFETGKGSDR